MIKFFRKIRQRLINENRISKYLLYAIGEIILVVIGILIALQINNWNEERKDNTFEKEVLSQIQENLVQDRKNLLDIKIWHQRAFDASEKLVNDSIRNNNLDSLPYWLGEVVHFSRFQSLTNSYEVLKSAGLQIVKDKELRKNLGVYYDDKVNHINKALGDIEYAFNNQWLPLMEAHATNFEFKKILEVGDMKRFFSETDAWRLLMLNRDNIGASIGNLEDTIDSIDRVLSLMPKNLKNPE
ncbi:DUF6090 family protein [Altibacter sp.]|uniref:DUF6090 family protein n=1 Tax=Altibacter sp. TaxID=2024823 RepID=UPI00258B48FF|nr:DUF6090 family protein [Altibacter sp.]MCW9038462.1 DUF6090 family protein [Altibacter sp.]